MARPYVQLGWFLDTETHRQLVEWTVANESAFEKSGVIGDPKHRDSRVLYRFAPFEHDLRERIRLHAPAVALLLGLPAFPLGEVEAQLTAHNDGHYFKRHVDNGSTETQLRRISYVYYFHAEPRGFQGGELILGEQGGAAVPVRNNSIIFFPSHAWHEVAPVRCASRAWRVSRFTVNGWVRTQA